ncbi:MAG: prepilin-type N-terminal cleavage/methylation domain-containing protein [Methylococcaceae bacterium]
MTRLRAKGFSLIELVIVIVVVGVLSTMTTNIITLPVKGYIDLERRTTLVDTAEMTLRRMQRDIRRSLSNSIRITGGTSLELLHIADGGRYRAKLASDGSGDILDFTGTEAVSSNKSFDVLGILAAVPSGSVVIYNLDSVSTGTTSDPNAYDGDNRRTIDNTSTVNKVVLTSATPFPFTSPQQRFFIVDTPITYSCVSGELRRYDNTIDAGYTIGGATTSLNYKIQAKSAVLSCSFSYDPGTAARAGLVTIEITLTDDAGESTKLIYQVHVDNLP